MTRSPRAGCAASRPRSAAPAARWCRRGASRERDTWDLQPLGHKQTLRRTLGSFTSFALGFAMTSITAAIFTVFSSPFDNVGGAAIWLWWPVLIGVLFITLVYGHLSARLPLTG